MALSELACRHAAAAEKVYKLFDTGGLYLDVRPTGNKIWRLKYNFNGKAKLLTIGAYPVVSLLDAREKQIASQRMIQSGLDPAAAKQDEKRLARFKLARTRTGRLYHGKTAFVALVQVLHQL